MRNTASESALPQYRRMFLACIAASALLVGGVSGSVAADEPENGRAVSDESTTVGCPLAAGMLKLLEDEIRDALQRRGIQSAYERFRTYAGRELESTLRRGTSSEVTGIGRLDWYAQLWKAPISAPAAAEEFTRTLHGAFLKEGGLDGVLNIAAAKLDFKEQSQGSDDSASSDDEPLEVVRLALERAREAQANALAPLAPGELRQLEQSLYRVLTGDVRTGHTLSSRSTGRRLIQLLEKANRESWIEAARALAVLDNPRILQQLADIPDSAPISIEEVAGDVINRIQTEAGEIIVGGRDKNVYQLDELSDVCAVIDVGGDDEYVGGAVSTRRPVLVVIDLAGNDSYVATASGSQGGAVLGVSMLLDLKGDDVYRARDVAQGSCLGGVGILVDHAGNDVYAGIRRVQGQAIGGVGILLDRSGNDRYHAAMWAQGFGGPLGFGVLDDLAGKDHYYAGGQYLDTYSESPGYEGWSQGVGAGLRQVANGGIGVILDGGGDDVYEFDYMGHGGGYWLGVGLARDFGGNDHRLGATETAFDGKPRSQKRFQRFGNGFGCHYSLGFCFDDAGNDSYDGTVMGVGFAWDLSVGVLCDFAGDDRYEAAGQHTQGSGAQASLGILFDYEGDDTYLGQGQGYASSRIHYHSLPACGGNFSYVVDYGGEDEYGSGVQNSSYNRRGSDAGFVIDRPERKDETTSTENVAQGGEGDAETEPTGSGLPTGDGE